MRKLNKDIEAKAKQLNQWILNQDVVKEFQKYEKLIQEQPQLLELETELKDMQKEIVQKKYHDEDCQELIALYNQKKQAFDENPLVYNYLAYKQEVNDLLIQIQDMINQGIQE